MSKAGTYRTEDEIKKINRIQSDFFGGLIDVFDPPLPDGVPEKLERIVGAARIHKDDTVMDVGAGTGVLVPIVQSYAPREIIACDLSIDMLHHLKENYPFVRIVHGDIRDIGEPEKSVDVVLINACYPNIADKEKSMGNVARMMQNGGRLVISHPMGKSFIEKLRERSPFPLDDFPSRSDADGFLKSFGLKILKFEDETDFYLLVAKKEVR